MICNFLSAPLRRCASALTRGKRRDAAALRRRGGVLSELVIAQAQAWVRVTRSGIPSADQPAASEGITVTRQWYTLDGKPLPPGPVKAGTTLVAVIGGEIARGEYVQGLVVDLLPADFARVSYTARQTLELRQHAVMPGLVNLHTHAAMSLQRRPWSRRFPGSRQSRCRPGSLPG
mgnify:CR=1 FL=1